MEDDALQSQEDVLASAIHLQVTEAQTTEAPGGRSDAFTSHAQEQKRPPGSQRQGRCGLISSWLMQFCGAQE